MLNPPLSNSALRLSISPLALSVVNIEAPLNCESQDITHLCVVKNMLVQRKGSVARAANSAKWKYLPFIDVRFSISFHIKEKSQDRSVLFQKSNLMEHSFYIPTHCYRMLSKSQQDSQK